eukprot:TRINITY_DN76500_c0_g1_i1.p1 TRINITY_DN76500_c0_g1~~TRINITY_DN76500_c0_g1_i1.p1  ORF type:complete len:476 (-),score=101.20 TRINITY_DN76500_c0_g1_i1:136-1563(-)
MSISMRCTGRGAGVVTAAGAWACSHDVDPIPDVRNHVRPWRVRGISPCPRGPRLLTAIRAAKEFQQPLGHGFGDVDERDTPRAGGGGISDVADGSPKMTVTTGASHNVVPPTLKAQGAPVLPVVSRREAAESAKASAAATAAATRLLRVVERGDAFPMPLLIDCLEKMRGLDFGAAVDGETQLALVYRVLHAARCQLSAENEDCQVLEIELAVLRSEAERLEMDIEDRSEQMIRAQGIAERNVQRQQRLEEQARAAKRVARTAVDLAEAEVASLQGKIGAVREEACNQMDSERTALESEIQVLHERIMDMNARAQVEVPTAKANEQLEAGERRMLDLVPKMKQLEQVKANLSNREKRIWELQATLEETEEQLQIVARRRAHRQEMKNRAKRNAAVVKQATAVRNAMVTGRMEKTSPQIPVSSARPSVTSMGGGEDGAGDRALRGQMAIAAKAATEALASIALAASAPQSRCATPP